MRPSVRSFFITLGLYIALGAAMWQMEFTLPKQEKQRISLASINIAKPNCECKKCTCKSDLHKKISKPLHKPQPLPKPKPLTKPVVKKTPKQARKKNKISHYPKVKPQQTKQIKKISPASKPAKTPPISSKPPVASVPATPTSKPSTQQSPKSALPPSKPAPVPKVSYQEEYFKKHLSSIREAIARHKFYPRLARKTKKEGKVVVEFALTPQGMRDLRIVKPSPHKILDRAALRCIKEASSEFPKPKELVVVRVPMEYRLR